MSIIKIYMEGGGDDNQRRAMLRDGMNVFLGELKNLAEEQSRKLRVICCGSRTEAFRKFKNARQENEADDIAVLLVDSEGPVEAGTLPRDYLKQETKGVFDNTPHDLMHLMVQTMETWIVSDPAALQKYYGEEFLPDKLPQGDNMEAFAKRLISTQLSVATRGTKQRKYHKIGDASNLLKLIRPSVVRIKCAHCDQFFTTLESLINGPAPA